MYYEPQFDKLIMSKHPIPHRRKIGESAWHVLTVKWAAVTGLFDQLINSLNRMVITNTWCDTLPCRLLTLQMEEILLWSNVAWSMVKLILNLIYNSKYK